MNTVYSDYDAAIWLKAYQLMRRLKYPVHNIHLRW